MSFNKAKALQDAEKCLSQGKTAQAIKLYLAIFEKEPTDLGILNTVGDLYVRDKNMPEALKYFHKLADSFTQEGFTVKAIAIYKKISKLDPASIEVPLKIAELYMVQGLSREAREQYVVALEFYKKKNQTDKALEMLRKIVALDPENTVYRLRLAEFCEGARRTNDAVQAYSETAEVALRRGDHATAENALKKVTALDAQNSLIPLLQVRLALGRNKSEDAAKIFDANPALKQNPAARQLLLDAYLGSRNFDAAEGLVVEAFHSNPDDFSPLASYTDLCLANENIEATFNVMAKVTDPLIEKGETGPLMEVLRRLWAKAPNHLPTLELIRKVAEAKADDFVLPEVLEALGHAYVAHGELEKAEGVYRKLLERQPEDGQLNALLKQVLQKLGKEQPAAQAEALASAEIALTAEAEPSTVAVAPASGSAAEEAATVKEALDNSDLFARYSLMDKAYAELEKATALYPNQIELHKRVFEFAQKGDPGRAAQAAKELARIYADQGDSASSKKYEHWAAAPAVPAVAEAAAQPELPPPSPTPPPAQPAPMEFDLSGEFLGGAASGEAETPLAPPPAPDVAADFSTSAAPPARASEAQPAEFDLSSTVAAEPAQAPAPVQEFDLSAGLESGTVGAPADGLPAAAPTPGFNYEESKVEVEYYLDQGFLEEARKAVNALEEKYTGNAHVAELRQLVDRRSTPPAPPEAEEWELPTSFGEGAPASGPVEAPTEPAPQREVAAPGAPEAPSAAPSGGMGGLIEGLEDTLAGIETSPPESHPPAARSETSTPASAPAAAAQAPSPLSGLLDELGEGEQPEVADDPQTHYDLGVAFREMNLLDEAIGEFQKVLKGAQKGHFPPNFLQACTLLAVCFMDKKLPAIAAKWYQRALELPDLDEEATLAVQYDLGVAFEEAGDHKSALEQFSEVYSQNIDYRDVAEKIRLLQSKA